MKRSLLFIALAVTATTIPTISTASQAHPDFSGQWTLEPAAVPAPPSPGAPPATPARGDMGSGWGSPLTITQDAKQMTVEYAIYTRYDLQPPLKFVYALDGSESKNTVMMGRGAEMRSSRAAWDGAALNITTLYTLPDPVTGKPFTTEVKQRLTLASPTSLVVEVTRSGALGGGPTTAKAVYRKG